MNSFRSFILGLASMGLIGLSFAQNSSSPFFLMEEGEVNHELSTANGTANVSARWSVPVPIYIPGLTAEQTQKLKMRVMNVAYSPCNSKNPSVAGVYQSITEHLAGFACSKTEEDALMYRNLDFVADMSVVAINDRWISFVNQGYENEGGNGCHSYTQPIIIAIPEIKPLTNELLITADKRQGWLDLLLTSLKDKYSSLSEISFEDALLDAKGVELFQPLPTEDGLQCFFPAYSIFCGAMGVTHITIPWKDAKPFINPALYDSISTLYTVYDPPETSLLKTEHQTGVCKLINRRENTDYSKEPLVLYTDADWDVELPTAVPGLNDEQLAKLRSQVMKMAYDRGEGHESSERGIFAAAAKDVNTAQSNSDLNDLKGFIFSSQTSLVAATDQWIAFFKKGEDTIYGGSGCSTQIDAIIFSLPDIEPLTFDKLIKKSKHREWLAFLKAQIQKLPDIGQEEVNEDGLSMFKLVPTALGLDCYFPPYTIFSGAQGVKCISLTWDNIKPFINENIYDSLKALSQGIRE